MKRVDWNKYFSFLIMVSFLRAVAKSYVTWRRNIPSIILQNLYCRVTWDNTQQNSCNALNSLVYPIDPTATLSNSYSMQPPLHKHNSVQGNPCFLHLEGFEHFYSHPHFNSVMHAFEASASVVQIGFNMATSIFHQKSWISYFGNFVCSTCTHMLKAIWPFYYTERVWKPLLV